jgi:hypothetical protein
MNYIKLQNSIIYKKKSAEELRDTYLQRLAAAVAATGNLKKETVIKQLGQREQQRSTAKKIKYLRGKLNRSSTTMVTVTNEDGTTTDIFDKNLMEKAIISSNQRKFSQSFGTPFYNAPYNRLFGYQGLTPSSKQTLMGTFNAPPNASTHMVNFLSHLVMPQNIRNNPTTMDMTLESFTSYWRKAKENISCYPSDLTFATMKASSYDSYLAHVDWILTRIPLISGYSPLRWQRCVDVMIPKKANKTDIDNLRTICLFEVDANFCFKHIGREMMKHGEKHGTIAKEQYGSRKSHRAIDLAVNKVLTNDIFRQGKRTGAICSNDAKACYDLIGHAQASLCMQRQGVPLRAVQCLFTTLQEAKHSVRTAYGDSNYTYGGSGWIKPLHGIGQGNGGGPPIWAVISSTLLDTLRSKGTGLTLPSPISHLPLSFVGYTFVDDNDLVQSDGDTPSNTVLKLQKAVDLWEGGLKCTGGALGPDKSYWYLVSFSWTGGKWYYSPVSDTPTTLHMNDINDVRRVVRRIPTNHAEETLGVWIAPDGNTNTQVKKLLDKALQWADQMRTGVIRKDETWLALHSTIWRTLSYPLNAVNITKAHWEKIMSPIINFALPTMGVCRNFPRDLVFSSYKFAGIGIRHLHTLQEIARLTDILHHTYINSTTGLLYHTS